MSALGQSSLGVFCDNPALGMSSLGVFCGLVASDPIDEIFDPTLAVISPAEVLRVLGDKEIYNAIVRKTLGVDKPTRSILSLRNLSLRTIPSGRGLEVQKDRRALGTGPKRRKVHVIINGQLVEAMLTDKDLLALLEAAELKRTDRLN